MMNGVYGAYNSGFNGCASGFFGSHLTTLLFVGTVIFAFYLLLKNKKQPTIKEPIFKSEKSLAVDPAEIVRLRYARGDISLEEFQAILKNIQS